MVSKRTFLFCLLLIGLTGCSNLSGLDERSVSWALTPELAKQTEIGRITHDLVSAQAEGKSGFRMLTDAQESFAVRMLMAENAEATLDVQYYIWRRDTTGLLLIDALYQAAERGVRVRLLLDDLNTGRLDPALMKLHQHPHAEVRLFNPFTVRASRTVGFIQDFRRANRRMHNKSMTVDNSATLIGGRNIGDQYFEAMDGRWFNDLDVLAIGPVVGEVSEQFDSYWQSYSAYPADVVISALSPTEEILLAERIATRLGLPTVIDYLAEIEQTAFVQESQNGQFEWLWAPALMVSDHPSKGWGRAKPNQLITYEMMAAIGTPKERLELVTPYFVPTRAGVDALVALAEQGVEILILTNSLEATDVAIVHAGYAKWRKELLQAGIRIFESKGRVQRRDLSTLDDDDEGQRRRIFGSSASSLHAKTFAVDGERVFIGSFNFDPRSAALNTELGFVIESEVMARAVDDAFLNDIPIHAYEVKLSPSGRLYWIERREALMRRHDVDPNTSLLKRTAVRFFSLLPIDWLL